MKWGNIKVSSIPARKTSSIEGPYNILYGDEHGRIDFIVQEPFQKLNGNSISNDIIYGHKDAKRLCSVKYLTLIHIEDGRIKKINK